MAYLVDGIVAPFVKTAFATVLFQNGCQEVGDFLRLPDNVFWFDDARVYGSQLVIRQCYTDIWDQITLRPHRNVVIIGSPGIGISWFLFFCMYKLAQVGQSFMYVAYKGGLTASYFMYTRKG